jgi:hypothetical protein
VDVTGTTKRTHGIARYRAAESLGRDGILVIEKVSVDHDTVVWAPAGSVVVFDAIGIHRGGVVRERERLIARSHCRGFQAAKVLSSPRALITTAERLLLHWRSLANAPSLV